MKAKKIYQICLVLSGLVLSLCGIACLVVGTLLDHDPDLEMSHESKSRTYGTQYWLGLPIIAFGGLLMLISPSLHKRKRMAFFNLFVCIPLLMCTLVAAVLHGSAYGHFNSVHQKRFFLEDHGYACANLIQDTTTCRCTKLRNSFTTSEFIESLPVPCDQQESLVGFHGALLAFVALSFMLLLGIVVVSVIFLLYFFKLQPQLAISSTTSGQENEGFSHARGRSVGVHIDPPPSQHPASVSTYVSGDHPPSYESLMSLFDVTSRSASYDVSDANSRSAVNRAARVRYRGQLSSRLNHQTPGRVGNGQSSSNEVLNSDEHENEAQVGDVDVTDTRNSGSTPRRHYGQASDALSTTRDASNDLENTARDNNEPRQEETTSSERNNTRNREPIPGRSVRITTQPSNEHSSEMATHESSPSRSHAALEPTVSIQSEDYVYIDITQANTPSSSDSAHIAVRYRGQLDSNSVNAIQTRSVITHEQENTIDESVVSVNLQESTTQNTTTHITDSSNATSSSGSTEQVTGSPTNVETASTDTENHLAHNIASVLDNQSTSSQSNDLNSLYLDPPIVRQTSGDTNSENSLEIEITDL